jgi:hypothetical protein
MFISSIENNSYLLDQEESSKFLPGLWPFHYRYLEKEYIAVAAVPTPPASAVPHHPSNNHSAITTPQWGFHSQNHG